MTAMVGFGHEARRKHTSLKTQVNDLRFQEGSWQHQENALHSAVGIGLVTRGSFGAALGTMNRIEDFLTMHGNFFGSNNTQPTLSPRISTTV